MRKYGLIAALSVLISAPARAEEPVTICDDNQPWPPYSYPAASESGVGDGARTGALVDFLEHFQPKWVRFGGSKMR
ncbi:MAG: hypothetical protein ACPGOY_17645 [Rhodospirillaceae bacterium]